MSNPIVLSIILIPPPPNLHFKQASSPGIIPIWRPPRLKKLPSCLTATSHLKRPFMPHGNFAPQATFFYASRQLRTLSDHLCLTAISHLKRPLCSTATSHLKRALCLTAISHFKRPLCPTATSHLKRALCLMAISHLKRPLCPMATSHFERPSLYTSWQLRI